MILSEQDKLYTGITTDIERRMDEHFTGRKGAKFFRIAKPKSLVYVTETESRSTASILEAQIKSLSRTQKDKLIANCEINIQRFNNKNKFGKKIDK